MKVIPDQKISNQNISNLTISNSTISHLFQDGVLPLFHVPKRCTPNRIIDFLFFPKSRWLVIFSLFFQIINPVLIDPVFASTDYLLNLPESPYPLNLKENTLSNWDKGQRTKDNVRIKERKKPNNRKSAVCLEGNIETLMTELLRNLPSYANRASQRARRLSRTTQTYSYMLMAGKPEFVPLPTNPVEDTGNTSKKSKDKDVKQVFFTTLERQYIKGKPIQSQQFHWLFLTKTENAWQMVMMFTQTGSYPKSKPPTPPRDSSNGVVGQAIQTWLRDCRVADSS
ncbi:MAG: hypothetical protein QNJ18_09440 [Xenococcaceae cyanobacterium MO_167.B52]|nr:hypothetical protein [Xenococcaceae cyanobacterium MO_167.B52]